MEKISFTKMSGAGNDFIVLRDFPGDPAPEFINQICDRRFGVGADGVITIRQTEDADFAMHYYNSDGLPGSLCGNGARCALKFASENFLSGKPEMHFTSGNRKYSGKILEKGIMFNLDSPERIRRNFDIMLGNRKITASFADSGSPHVVIFLDAVSEYFGTKYSLSEIPVESLGKEIRYNDEFFPNGTNVNFADVSAGNINIRTYERGVENETYACGTGSVATAVISFLEGFVKPPVNLITRTGETLQVDFQYSDKKFSKVSLTGPADIIFTGEYRIKKML